MARDPIHELLDFLGVYEIKVAQVAIELREFVLNLFPEANELIYDSYNAVAIAYSISDKQSDAFCHISVYEKYVNLGFNRGAELKDSKTILQGTGKAIRHFTVKNFNELPRTYLIGLLNEAHCLALVSSTAKKQTIKGISIVKSSSANKKRPSKI